ncbi:DinB family protein [Fulvivirga sedimenti]|uniref:DinB family protein n=1 Tax=Fulvivirga sedimenti TaxID=2879465 RepID=A0A9X1HKQ1_9BACT|nr:DinB family protein [Fulvivirga sedimenti]MCA6073770.1 DinB family protein [Fulvivirga sedimenti]
MQRTVLLDLIHQNRVTSSYALDRVAQENAQFRLNEKCASIGFILRHMGETMNMFGMFFGVPTDVQNTTMGQTDSGKEYDVKTSRELIRDGYQMLIDVVNEKPDSFWSEEVQTPFFGTVSNARLFGHILFHNSHHCGQISLTLERGV